MKRSFMLLILMATMHYAVSQCNPYYNLDESVIWEMQTYDAKGKVEGKQTNKVINYEESEDGWKATINSKVYDKKDKEMQDLTFDLTCSDGTIEVDLTKYIPQETLQAFKDMNMKFEGKNLIIPKKLEVGQKLADGSMTISGDLPFTITINITDRVVEGKETITVPAGTFEVYKITYTTNVKTIMSNEMKGVEYVAEKVGVVKQESYKKNGKLMSYSELTSYSNP